MWDSKPVTIIMWWTWQMVFAFAIASVIQLSHTLRTERSRAECGGGICRPAAQRQAMQYCRMLRSNVTQRCIMPSTTQSSHLGTVRQRLSCASQVRSENENNDHMQLLHYSTTGRMAGGDVKAHTKHNRRALTACQLVYNFHPPY